MPGKKSSFVIVTVCALCVAGVFRLAAQEVVNTCGFWVNPSQIAQCTRQPGIVGQSALVGGAGSSRIGVYVGQAASCAGGQQWGCWAWAQYIENNQAKTSVHFAYAPFQSYFWSTPTPITHHAVDCGCIVHN
jgi:hypothetical protein